MYRLYWKMTIYGHFQYNLYIFGIHLWTVLYPKPCYNKLCYKEVVVYVGFFPIYVLCLSEIRTQMMMMIWCFMSLSTLFKSYRLKGDNKRLRTIKCCTAELSLPPAGLKPGTSWSEVRSTTTCSPHPQLPPCYPLSRHFRIQILTNITNQVNGKLLWCVQKVFPAGKTVQTPIKLLISTHLIRVFIHFLFRVWLFKYSGFHAMHVGIKNSADNILKLLSSESAHRVIKVVWCSKRSKHFQNPY